MAAPNIWTVGTAKVFATISGAIAAAGTVAGDVIEVYDTAGHTYAEQVSYSKTLQIIGMLGWAGLTITSNSGGNVTVGLNALGAQIENFTIINTSGAANSRALGSNVNVVWAKSCRLTGSLFGCLVGAGGGPYLHLQNCLIDNNNQWGAYCVNASNGLMLHHCTVVKNVLGGVGRSAGWIGAQGCLAAGNGAGGDYSAVTGYPYWNVSGDLTAPGAGSVTGFNTADFVNFAGNNFGIRPGARLTTLARLPGYSVWEVVKDITGRRRPTRERVMFAGCYYCFEQPTWGVGEMSGIA